MAERAPPPFPERIGRYDVLLPIASGGMGTVYLARTTGIAGFEREVALKLMHSHLRENDSFARDLIEEAKLTVRIRHPNVVSVVDVGEDPFGVYLVMDYVEGDTLAGLQRRAIASLGEALPVRFGLKLLLDALAGLHAAHELKDANGVPTNLVHRDFSPQNILVGVDGIGRLTDFGIAKAATRIGETATGIKGKIAYMAPEQARGSTIDRRTDVWAAGVVAWQLISGRKLYGGSENEVSTLLKIASAPPPRLRDVKPDVPAAFDEVVAKALAMDSEQRWPTAHAFKQALASACLAHGELADTDEVATFTARAVEPMIAERRARVTEIVRLRAKVGRLVGEVIAPTSTPSLDSEQTETLSMDAAQTQTQVVATRVGPLVAPHPNSSPLLAPSAQDPMVTRMDATSVTQRVAAAGTRSWAFVAYAGVAVALVTGVAIGVSLTSRTPAPAPATAPQPTSIPASTTAPHASDSVSVDVASLPIAASVAPAASASVISTASARPSGTARPPKRPAASSDQVLPRSPYEGRP
jgi:serine/threonine-protein kinase